MDKSPKTQRLGILHKDLLELQASFDLQNLQIAWLTTDVNRAQKRVVEVEEDYQLLHEHHEYVLARTTKLESLKKDAVQKAQQIKELIEAKNRLETERMELANRMRLLDKKMKEQEKAHRLSSDGRHRHHIQQIEALQKENGQLKQQAEDLANQMKLLDKKMKEQEKSHRLSSDGHHRHHIRDIEALQKENGQLRQQVEDLAKQEVVLRAEARGREEALRQEAENLSKSNEAEKRKQKLESQATIAHLSDNVEELHNEVLQLKNGVREREENHRQELEDLKMLHDANRRKQMLDAHADVGRLADRVEELQNEAITLRAEARDREEVLRQELRDYKKDVELEKRKQRLEAQAQTACHAEKLEALAKEQSLLTVGARNHEDALHKELDILKQLHAAERRQQRLESEATIASLSDRVEALQNQETILRAAGRDREAALRRDLEEFKNSCEDERRKERSDAQLTIAQLSKKVESLKTEVAEKERKIKELQDDHDVGNVDTELDIVDRLFSSLSPESEQQKNVETAAVQTEGSKAAEAQQREPLSEKTKGKRLRKPQSRTRVNNMGARAADEEKDGHSHINLGGAVPDVGACRSDLENRNVLANMAQPVDAEDGPGGDDGKGRHRRRGRPARKCAEATNQRIATSCREEAQGPRASTPTTIDEAGEGKRKSGREDDENCGPAKKQAGPREKKRRRRAQEAHEKEQGDDVDPPQPVDEASRQHDIDDGNLQGTKTLAAKKAADSRIATDPLGALSDKARAAASFWKDPSASAAAPFKIPQPRAKARGSSAAHKKGLLPRSSLAHTDTLSVASLFGTGFTVPKLRKPELR